MNTTSFKSMAATSLIALTAMALSAPAQAGNGNAVGAGLIGLGIGAIVGSALTPREVYVVSPPVYYAPVAYGAPPGRRSGTPTAPKGTGASTRAPAILGATGPATLLPVDGHFVSVAKS
jgi:hypothetical protein